MCEILGPGGGEWGDLGGLKRWEGGKGERWDGGRGRGKGWNGGRGCLASYVLWAMSYAVGVVEGE